MKDKEIRAAVRHMLGKVVPSLTITTRDSFDEIQSTDDLYFIECWLRVKKKDVEQWAHDAQGDVAESSHLVSPTTD